MAGERERLASERLQTVNARAASSAAAAEALRSEVSSLHEELEQEGSLRRDAEAAARRAESALAQVCSLNTACRSVRKATHMS